MSENGQNVLCALGCNQGSNKLSHNCLSQDLNTLCNVLSFYVFDSLCVDVLFPVYTTQETVQDDLDRGPMSCLTLSHDSNVGQDSEGQLYTVCLSFVNRD